MASDFTERNRMILELPSEVQMAIKLRAVKCSTTTGAVVSEAVQTAFGKYVEEARAALAEQQHKPINRRQKS
jgi:hypothetical protein